MVAVVDVPRFLEPLDGVTGQLTVLAELAPLLAHLRPRRVELGLHGRHVELAARARTTRGSGPRMSIDRVHVRAGRIRSSCRAASAHHAATWNIASFGDQPSGGHAGLLEPLGGIDRVERRVQLDPRRVLLRARAGRRQRPSTAPWRSAGASGMNSKTRSPIATSSPGFAPSSASLRSIALADQPPLELGELDLVVQVGLEHPVARRSALHPPAATLAGDGEPRAGPGAAPRTASPRAPRPAPPSTSRPGAPAAPRGPRR